MLLGKMSDTSDRVYKMSVHMKNYKKVQGEEICQFPLKQVREALTFIRQHRNRHNHERQLMHAV